jgi:hypothetical protein
MVPSPRPCRPVVRVAWRAVWALLALVPSCVPAVVGEGGAAGGAEPVVLVGADSLITQSPVGPDAVCAAGGVRLDSGTDDDRDGVLDPEEVDASRVVCAGADGTDGVDGADGAEGADGADAPAAIVSVVRTRAAAAADGCANGGVVIEVGLDRDRDAVLDDDEVDGRHTIVACDGADGAAGGAGSNGGAGTAGASPLLAVAAAGGACPTTGVVVFAGLDQDGDGLLDDGERDPTLTSTVCGGLDGGLGPPGGTIVGRGALLVLDDAGAACATGGVRVRVGVDANGDGALADDEVTGSATRVICAGVAGTTLPAPGGASAPSGTLAGDVTVRGGLDVLLLQDVTRIEGDLVIQASIDPYEARLPNLVRVGSLAVQFDHTRSVDVVLAGLRDVDRDLVIRDDTPSLLVTRQVPPTTFMLGGLQRVGGDVDVGAVFPLALSFDSLIEVGGKLDLVLTGNDSSCALPALRTVGGVVLLEGMPGPVFALPALTSAAGVRFEGDFTVQELRLPVLERLVGGPDFDDVAGFAGFQLVRSGALRTVEAPRLTEATRMLVEANEALTSLALPALARLFAGLTLVGPINGLSLPALVSVGGSIAIDDAPSLTDLSLGPPPAPGEEPALRVAEDFLIDLSPALATLDDVHPGRIGGDVRLSRMAALTSVATFEELRQVRGSILVSSCASLPRCAVEALRALPGVVPVSVSAPLSSSPFRGQTFTGTDCRAPCGAACPSNSACFVDDSGVDACVCRPGFVRDGATGATCVARSTSSAAIGTSTRPAVDCAEVLAVRTPPPTGIVPGVVVQPSAGLAPSTTTCDFATLGGGWTLRSDRLEDALRDTARRYLLVAGSAAWASPVTRQRWSFSSYRAVPGRWTGVSPAGVTSFFCAGDGPAGGWGVGCSSADATLPGSVLPGTTAGPPAGPPTFDAVLATTSVCEGAPAVLGGCLDDAVVLVRAERDAPRPPPDDYCPADRCEDDGSTCRSLAGGLADVALPRPADPAPGALAPFCDGPGFAGLAGRCVLPMFDDVRWGHHRARCAAAGGHLVVPDAALLDVLTHNDPIGLADFDVGVCDEDGIGTVAIGPEPFPPLPVEGAIDACVHVEADGRVVRTPCDRPGATAALCAFGPRQGPATGPRGLAVGPTGARAVGPTSPTLDDAGAGTGMTIEAFVFAPADAPLKVVAAEWGLALAFEREARHVVFQLNEPLARAVFLTTGGEPALVPADRWTHVAATVDYVSDEGVLYIDGVEASRVALGGARTKALRTATIEVGSASAGAATVGVDEVRVWSRVRTSAEIAQAALPAGNERTVPRSRDGLAARWSFDTGGASVVDDSGGGATLRLLGGATLGVPATQLEVP